MKKYIGGIFLLLLALLFLYPVIMTVVKSFHGETWFQLKGYWELFFDCFVFYPMFWNSFLYSLSITVLQLVVIIPCAFGFAKAQFKGKHSLFVFYIMLMMMPLQVTILPNYIGLKEMGLLNHPLGIILPMIFSPFGVVVMHQYMKSMEDSVIEAARMDTNSIIRIMFVSVIPQLKVCIMAIVLFVFADCWNMVEQPMLFLKADKLKTLTNMISQTDRFSAPVLASASVLFMIPICLIYLFFHENLECGLTLKDL